MLLSVAEITEPPDIKRLTIIFVMASKSFPLSTAFANAGLVDCPDLDSVIKKLARPDLWTCAPRSLPLFLARSGWVFRTFPGGRLSSSLTVQCRVTSSHTAFRVTFLTLSLKSVGGSFVCVISVSCPPLMTARTLPICCAVIFLRLFWFHAIIITQHAGILLPTPTNCFATERVCR